MNTIPLWAQFVIALISSGLFGAIAGVLAARQQIKQLEITYQQKLNDNFLQNTRQYIETLYIPINIRLTKLADCFAQYKSNKSLLKTYRRFKKG